MATGLSPQRDLSERAVRRLDLRGPLTECHRQCRSEFHGSVGWIAYQARSTARACWPGDAKTMVKILLLVGPLLIGIAPLALAMLSSRIKSALGGKPHELRRQCPMPPAGNAACMRPDALRSLCPNLSFIAGTVRACTRTAGKPWPPSRSLPLRISGACRTARNKRCPCPCGSGLAVWRTAQVAQIGTEGLQLRLLPAPAS